ncbi:MAG TPA: hypothetical protein VKR06_17440 [Ktedonosporobacter sp.]|nr:hypothetical protein [Ktedonosporobacter sp.]
MHKHFLWHVGSVIFLVVWTLAGFTLLSSPTARAATILLNCTGSVSLAFTPGINSTLRDITLVVKKAALSCPDLSGTPSITEEQLSLPLGQLNCETLLSYQSSLAGPASPTSQLTLDWPTGEQSQISWQSVTDSNTKGQPTLTLTGTVTSGKGNGSSVELALTGSKVNPLACLGSKGINSLKVNATLTLSTT